MAGFHLSAAQPGVFCPSTVEALLRFQHARGLPTTGACDEECWRALIEAGWTLGDRMLVLTSPNLRGDDVVELQTDLARLGFDCGRIDGIFGVNTARAVAGFQSDIGLNPDGVCGSDTVRAIRSVIGQTGSGPGISAIREQLRLTYAPASLHSLRAVVGQFHGIGLVARAVARMLRQAGAQVVTVDEPDARAQALTANRFEAHLYIGFDGQTGSQSIIHYYQVPTFESVGGRTLATCLSNEYSSSTTLSIAPPMGMRLPVLRETRMTAVLCSLAPIRAAVDAAPALAYATLAAVNAWIVQCRLPLD